MTDPKRPVSNQPVQAINPPVEHPTEDTAGNPAYQLDAHGNIVRDANGNPVYVKTEAVGYGNPPVGASGIAENARGNTDPNGNPSLELDDQGNVVNDIHGNPIQRKK